VNSRDATGKTTMDHDAHRLPAFDPVAVAQAMLDRGFAQLLVRDALDDGPVTVPSRPPPAPGLERVLEPGQRRAFGVDEPQP
jgi:hypothetical protein